MTKKHVPIQTDPKQKKFSMEVGKLVLLIALQSSNNSNYIEKFSELDDSDRERLTEVLREYMDDDNESEFSEGGFTS